MKTVDISDQNLAEAKAFLERTPETSLFLLSNLRAFGTRLGESLYSGNFKGLEEHGKLAAIFCLTRGGGLLAQAGGRTDLARQIVHACAQEALPIRGVLGDWNVSKAIWDLLCADETLKETLASKELMYRLRLGNEPPLHCVDGLSVRMLQADDHDQWQQLSEDFVNEVGLPLLGSRAQRKAAFVRSAGINHWWGAFDGLKLVSIIGIIALHETTAQIGGVFTPPSLRRRGYSRAVLTKLLQDSRDVHHLDRLFLFTGEENSAARKLYESVGFETFGHFGLFFGEPRA